MIFIGYLIFIIYWSLEGYNSALIDYYTRKNKNYKKIKLVRYSLRSIFSFMFFNIIYCYSDNIIFSLSLISSFFLVVPNFYYGFKYLTFNKFYPNKFKCKWWSSIKRKYNGQICIGFFRLLLMITSALLVLFFTFYKIQILQL